ncbi:MAG: FAD-dependent oxidoreductase [Kiritimatiellia bacterium]|jgi:ferredoxin-NADP reductase|nr:FAD-dependent oxidoreductase [Kiritimatiellia bacterium]
MKLLLKSKQSEGPGVMSYIFEAAAPLIWKAGQFLHFVLHHEPTDNRGSDRWFTIASAPSEKSVMLTTRLMEQKGSTFKLALEDLKPGDAIEMSDLDGDFVVEDLTAHYVFIAGGIGITPIRSILKELDHAGQSISATLLYANRDEHVAFREELDHFAQHNPKLKIHDVTAPQRVDAALIKDLVPDLKIPLFYVSGPEPMVEQLGQMLKDLGVPTDHLKQDWFPGYPAE